MSHAQVRDTNGKFYKTFSVRNQIWFAENLSVDKFRNGDTIPESKNSEDWLKARENAQPAWCYYNYNSKNGRQYGKLYNWYAVNDPRGLAPEGWHIPSSAEWDSLVTYLGGMDIAGTKMKAKNGWKNNGNGTNNSGFSGLPGSYCGENGTFNFLGQFAIFWTATESEIEDAFSCNLTYVNGNVYKDIFLKGEGLSVRCIKD